MSKAAPSPKAASASREEVDGIIKAPGAKKSDAGSSVSAASKAGKRALPDDKAAKDSGKGKAATKGKGAKDKAEKEKKKKEGKAKKKPKKNCFTKLLASVGIGTSLIRLTDSYAIETASALDLKQSHLMVLMDAFENIDVDGSGNIDVDEFLEHLGEGRSPFTDRLFALVDLDGSGSLEFDEFVRILCTYCMFSKDEILKFCFECYDVDGSGTIDEKEFVELCRTVNNAAPTYPANFKRALEEFDVNEDGLIDYAEFLELDRRYPLILFPAYRLQDTMQKCSLGEQGWLQVIENYQRQKQIEEYKATHGGRLPPDPPLVAVAKYFLPCLFREKVTVKLGASMAAAAGKR